MYYAVYFIVRCPMDPHWTSYVGMITGVAGMVLAYISYRKSSKVKVLDLRVELRKAITEATAQVLSLTTMLDEAKVSKENIMAAIGKYGSGGTRNWLQEHELDVEKIQTLSRNLPSVENDHRNKSERELENLLIEVHRIHTDLEHLQNKYTESMADDKARSKERRNDMLSNIKR